MSELVAWSELRPYFSEIQISEMRERVEEMRANIEHRRLVDRMGEIAKECARMSTATIEERDRWLALQGEFGEITRKLEAAR